MNSHLPVGRLADRLHSLPRERAWFAILLSVTALALANAHFPRIGLAPLYMPIVCAACWALGSRAGYLVAIVAAVLAVVPHLAELPGLSPALLGARMAVRAVTYVIVAAIVLSFRRSFDREHHLAVRDRMTDALNKETFRERVIHRLDLAVPARQTFLLAILDLDDFKFDAGALATQPPSARMARSGNDKAVLGMALPRGLAADRRNRPASAWLRAVRRNAAVPEAPALADRV